MDKYYPREHSTEVPKDPVGVNGSSPIAFGGGMVLGNDSGGRNELREQDPVCVAPDFPTSACRTKMSRISFDPF